jgi:hypothetical protein
VHTASDFGRELLGLIFRHKDSLQRLRPV